MAPLRALRSVLSVITVGAFALKSAPGSTGTPRVALIKFPRTGSTLMMNVLTEAACSTKACRENWAREIFDHVCPDIFAACPAPTALAAVQQHSDCRGTEGCGWSLNLNKHQHTGMDLWPKIVEIMAAQPMTVIFLTRKDLVAEFVSYQVGEERRLILRSKEFQSHFGQHVCNAFQFYNCPPEAADWVDKHIYFSIDLRQMHDQVLKSQSNAKAYAKLEAELRERKLPNLKILRVTYEDLQLPQAWSEIFASIGRPHTEAPKMIKSNYSKFISNWDDVAAYSRLVGGVPPSLLKAGPSDV